MMIAEKDLDINRVEEWWQAVVDRNAAFDGLFFYAVRTTGIYCIPSCAAKTPNRANVAFFTKADAAERAGFRACKRCKPDVTARDDPDETLVARMTAFIVHQDSAAFRIEDAATHLGMSAATLRRKFKRATGLAPQEFAQGLRARRVRQELHTSASVTDAMYNAGYNSSGHFYEHAAGMLGMSPKEFRAGASKLRITFALGECSLGIVLVAATEKGVCSVTLGDGPEALLDELRRDFPKATLIGGDAAFESTVAQVVGLVEHPERPVKLPLDLRGTVFQIRVWKALARIPAGTTLTYSELARAIGAPGAARAVASACARNKLAVAIPCHRVVRKGGELAGYRWGIERKEELLRREQED